MAMYYMKQCQWQYYGYVLRNNATILDVFYKTWMVLVLWNNVY